MYMWLIQAKLSKLEVQDSEQFAILHQHPLTLVCFFVLAKHPTITNTGVFRGIRACVVYRQVLSCSLNRTLSS